ncbi:MAG: hypothetical protein RR478_05555 [Bacilli bacterium]
MEENKEVKIKRTPHEYKVMIGDKVLVFRQEYAGNLFYKICIKQKDYENKEFTFYRNIHFVNGTDIKDRTIIIIKNMFEYFRFAKTDVKKYSPISELMILDYEEVIDGVKLKEEAQDEYKEFVNSNDKYEDLPF